MSEPTAEPAATGIGLLAERSLHAALKDHLSQPGDRQEVKLGRYFIDIVRDDLLIEIQTRHLYALRPKLRRLLPEHPVRLVHPLARNRWIIREDRAGNLLGRRRSPYHATIYDIFSELVRITEFLDHPHFSLEVLFIDEEQVWRDDGRGSWRRGRWSMVDRRLAGAGEAIQFARAADYLALLPPLSEPFTNRELAAAAGVAPNLAQKMTYVLRQAGLLAVAGKRGNTLLHYCADR